MELTDAIQQLRTLDSTVPAGKKDIAAFVTTMEKIVESVQEWVSDLTDAAEALGQLAGEFGEADGDDRDDFHASVIDSAGALVEVVDRPTSTA